MDRRHFCKVAAFAAGAIGLSLPKASASGTLSRTVMTRGCRVTVIRRECYEDLQSLYLDDPETGRCDRFETDDSVVFRPGDGCPRGFCPAAFETLKNAVDGISSCTPPDGMANIILTSCPDGSRPVIFKIEFGNE